MSADELLSAFLNGYFTVVKEDTSQDFCRNSETLSDLLIQALEVQTPLVVAQGLNDEFGDDFSHPETGSAKWSTVLLSGAELPPHS